MTGFDFQTTPRILCADGAAVSELPGLLRERGLDRPFLVTDAGLVRAGAVDGVFEALRAATRPPIVFSDVLADPPESSVLEAVRAAVEAGADCVIGLGGGSSLDTAKLVALLGGAPQALGDIYGIGLAKGPRLPLIQIPTTAGTGSEVTPIAIVTTPDDQKKGLVSPLLLPDVALLDATLTLGLPPRITAMTGVDAMVHAIEAYTSRRKKNALSDSLAIAALKRLYPNLARAVADGADLEARRANLEGSLLAGMAFANAPVAAVHALAYPLGGIFHAPHGLSNALVLAPVLEFNLTEAEGHYGELAQAIGVGVRGADLIDAMKALTLSMPMEQRLSEIGVERQHLDRLADDAMKIERLLVNNPREMTRASARAIYESVL